MEEVGDQEIFVRGDCGVSVERRVLGQKSRRMPGNLRAPGSSGVPNGRSRCRAGGGRIVHSYDGVTQWMVRDTALLPDAASVLPSGRLRRAHADSDIKIEVWLPTGSGMENFKGAGTGDSRARSIITRWPGDT